MTTTTDPLPVECTHGVISPEDYSVIGNRRAAAFARFVRPFVRGYVLDVGCGAAYVPLYLEGYPADRITGLDPVPAPHPFEYWPGTADSLPAYGTMFQTVICATVLDHIADPQAAVREMARVLAPDGVFLSWETIVPDSEDGADGHHAFRFTEPTLMVLLGHWFAQTAVDYYRDGMRPGCAERFSAWVPVAQEYARVAAREKVAA